MTCAQDERQTKEGSGLWILKRPNKGASDESVRSGAFLFLSPCSRLYDSPQQATRTCLVKQLAVQ